MRAGILEIKQGEWGKLPFDFTFGETDNALYWSEVEGMDDAELIEAYKEQMRCRGEGGDADYNIQMCLDILENEAGRRKIELPEVPEDKVIFGYIRMIETPESSSIEAYGYDYYTKTLHVRFRSGKRNAKARSKGTPAQILEDAEKTLQKDPTYHFKNVPEEIFKDLQDAKSKGSFISKNIKGKFKT